MSVLGAEISLLTVVFGLIAAAIAPIRLTALVTRWIHPRMRRALGRALSTAVGLIRFRRKPIVKPPPALDVELDADDYNAIVSPEIGEMSQVMAAVIPHWPDRVHRRLHTITFVGGSRIRHNHTLEVTVPLEPGWSKRLRLVPQPVGLFSKHVLTALVSRDESGKLLSHPITSENRRLTTRLLWDMMALVTKQQRFTELEDDAKAVAWALTGSRDLGRAARPWLQKWLVEKAGPAPGKPLPGDLRSALDSLFVDLAEQYYLSVLLDPADGPDRVIQLSYDEHPPPRTGRRWSRAFSRQDRDTLTVVQLGLAASTHVEVEAPPGCLFTRSRRARKRTVDFESAVESGAHESEARLVEALGQILSVAVHSLDATLTARIRKNLCLARGGLAGPAVLISVVTALLLVSAYVVRLATFQNQTGVASVVAVLPAAYVAVAHRPSDHPVTHKLEAVARWAMVLSAALSLAAAASLVVTFPPISYGGVPVIGGILRQHLLGWRAVWWGLLAFLAAMNAIWVAARYRRELRGIDTKPMPRVSA